MAMGMAMEMAMGMAMAIMFTLPDKKTGIKDGKILPASKRRRWRGLS